MMLKFILNENQNLYRKHSFQISSAHKGNSNLFSMCLKCETMNSEEYHAINYAFFSFIIYTDRTYKDGISNKILSED